MTRSVDAIRTNTGMVGIVGYSGSGKTTLIEALLPLLAVRGLTINVVKHSHHDIEFEPPGKDSARLRMAGAGEVLLATPYRYMLTHELRCAPEPSLADLLARMAPTDLTLVEGFKWESIRKLEVYRSSLGKPPLYPDDGNIVAVASDAPKPMGAPLWLDLNRPERIVEWLLAGSYSGADAVHAV